MRMHRIFLPAAACDSVPAIFEFEIGCPRTLPPAQLHHGKLLVIGIPPPSPLFHLYSPTNDAKRTVVVLHLNLCTSVSFMFILGFQNKILFFASNDITVMFELH
jgi:hypothetical protein